MISVLLLATLAQDPGPRGLPNIGDTVWVTRSVLLPAGASVRPRPIEAADRYQPLGPPTVTGSGRNADIRYPMVFWSPGLHTVSLPGPILVRADGWSDTLRAAVARVEIGSVLPPGPADTLEPAPPEPAMAWSRPALVPVAVLWLAGAVVLLPLWRWWGRRGPRPAIPPPPARPAIPAERWRAAGEHRALLDHWRHRVTAAADHPRRAELLARLERARYAEHPGRALDGLEEAVAELTDGGP